MKHLLLLAAILSGVSGVFAADEATQPEILTPYRIFGDAPRETGKTFRLVNRNCFTPRPPAPRIGIFDLQGPNFWNHGSPFLYYVALRDGKGNIVAKRRLGVRSFDHTRRGYFFGGRPDVFPPLAADTPRQKLAPAKSTGEWDSPAAFAPILTSRNIALYDSAGRLGKERESTAGLLDAFGVPYTRLENFDGLGEFDVLVIGTDSLDITVAESAGTIRSFVEGGKRLLVFRQSGDGRYPFLPELQRTELTQDGFLPEVMQPTHPVFKNNGRFTLSQACSEGYGGLIRPASPAALLLGEGRDSRFFGMVSAHLKAGKGDMILSQGYESQLAGKTFESTLYFRRIMETILDERTREHAKAFYPGTLGTLRKMNREKLVFIPLGEAADWDTADETANDQKGGYADQGKDNDLRLLPTGRQNFRGFHFDISETEGKRLVLVSTNPQRPFQAESREIPVNEKLERLYFLHTAAWMARAGAPVAEYIVTYESGETERIPVISGWNIADWWNAPNAKLQDAECIWRIRNGRNVMIGAFGCVWSNPAPAKTIKSIRMVGRSHTVTALIAITGEK